MSQLSSTGATVSSNITAWNRTPGKPGTGSGNTVFPSNRWPSSKVVSSATADIKRDLHIDDCMDKNTVNDSDSTPSLWPPLFDPQRIGDVGSIETTTQWSVPAFSGSTTSNALLGSSDVVNPSSSTTWAMHPVASDSSIPRAITGQQLNHSNVPSDADHTRRFLLGQTTHLWPSSCEPSVGLNDDTLSIALSKVNVSNTTSTGSCFQPIHDFNETSPLPLGEHVSDSTYEHKERAKSSIESAELEALFPSEPEDTIRNIVNATEPWGIRPVDQSTPWDTSDLLGDSTLSPTSADVTQGAGRVLGGAHSTSLFEGPSVSQQPRRLSGISAGNRDLESNVWPSEPPNGTGIWESHYENLGERTARWQQTLRTSTSPACFSSQQPSFMAGPVAAVSRGQLLDTSNGGSFRSFIRPNLGPLLGNTSVSKSLSNSPFHGASSPTGSSRAFPLAANSGPWPFPPGPTTADSMMSGKGRWANSNFNRITGKHQQPVAHLFSGQAGNGVRWPPMNNPSHMPTGWPVADPRRPNMMPGNWGASASGDQMSYFGPGHPVLPPASRMCQPGNEFTAPIGPGSARGGTVSGNTPTQVFRPTHNAFYSSVAQRAFLSPQQHSQQLQQQSVLRANAMRQLIQLGFPDDEIQAIFSDINTNVERALIDLRDRTCHPGLDEIIRSFAHSGLMPLAGQDENVGAELARSEMFTGGPGSVGVRSLAVRPAQHLSVFDQSLPKSFNPNENLDLSINVLQQRETQILQTIMQLQSKHQELNQRLNQIRSANLPFATNPVLQELQLQAIQVASQIDAQHAQLKQIRSQAGMLKQLATAAAAAANTQFGAQTNMSVPSSCNNSAFTPPPLTSGVWIANTTSAVTPSVMCAVTSGQQQSPQFNENPADQNLDPQDSGLKLGSGSLMWETGPWSGPGPRSTASFDPYSSSAVDRRWSSAALPIRPPYGALGDPRWSMDNNAPAANLLLTCDNDLPPDDGTGNRRVSSRSWLLAHNIPPHVSVSILKMAASTALMRHAKSMGNGEKCDSHLDFELHPNMSARWVLIGLANSTDSSVVQEYLESSGGEQNGAHYGSVKAISPAEALLRLQDIQSLASRFKTISTADGSVSRAVTQPTCVASFAALSSAGGIGDFSIGDSINRPIGETN